MANAENLDFLNLNSLRNFPIKEGLNKTSSDGVFIIPDDLIVDFVMSASSTVGDEFYISKIVNLPETVTIEISNVTSAVCGTIVIPVSTHTLYKEYYLNPSNLYPNANGKMVIGSLDTINTLPFGTFAFPGLPDSGDTNTTFETRTIIPCLGTISKFLFTNADGSSFAVTGDVVLTAGKNIKFRQVSSNTVAIDAGEGLGLNASCNADKPSIKTINSISPDIHGNFTLAVSDCAKFTPLSGVVSGLTLSDICCKPCLGCDEIGELTTRLMTIESELLKLRGHYTALSALSTQLNTVTTASCEC